MRTAKPSAPRWCPPSHRSRNRLRPSARSVLAIGAHPDDVELGVGGILLKHAEQGHRVTILTVSQGEKGGPSALRRLESQAAADALGAELLFGEGVDTRLRADRATVRLIREVLEFTEADTVYTHSAHDRHQDHRAVASATLLAGQSAARMYAYQSPSTNLEFVPTVFENIEGFVDRKLALLAHYRSQTQRPYLARETVIRTARYWGRFADFHPCEPLTLLRETR